MPINARNKFTYHLGTVSWTFLIALCTEYTKTSADSAKYPSTPLSPSDNSIALNTFKDMKVWSGYSIECTDNGASTSHAHVSTDHLHQIYHLAVSKKSIENVILHASTVFSYKDYFQAICSHEAVHARENHQLINVFVPLVVSMALVNLTSRHISNSYFLFSVMMLSMRLSSSSVSRYLEFRADSQAAEQPRNRECLIAFLAAQEKLTAKNQLEGFTSRFWSYHPSPRERKEILQAKGALLASN